MTAPVAAIIILKEEELITHFRTHGALSSATAMTPSALSISEDMTFRRLRDRGVIRTGAPGTFYVDEEAVARRRTTRRQRMLVLLGALILAAVAVALFNRSVPA